MSSATVAQAVVKAVASKASKIPSSLSMLLFAGGAVLLWLGLTGGKLSALHIPSLSELTGGNVQRWRYR